MVEYLYYIWSNHWRVRYNGIEYDMQILNYRGGKPDKIEILITYTYNDQNHMLVKSL